MLDTEDEKGVDQKVIAIPCDNIDMNSISFNDISDINSIQLDVIRHFFSNYKANEKNKWVKIGEFRNSQETLDFITPLNI